MNLKPLHDRILVKRVEEIEQRPGGLFIPDSAKEKPHQGEVVAIGEGKRTDGGRVAPDVKVGDRILFGKHAGTEVKIGEDAYLMLSEGEILGVIGPLPGGTATDTD